MTILPSRIQEYTGEKFKNDKAIPGSTTYYLENTEKRESLSDSSKYTDEELMKLQKYLPRCFPKKAYLGKSPKEIVSDDGWTWEEKTEVFQHPDFYDKDTKDPINFKGVLKVWNDERYLVPLNNEGIVDKNGLCWSYDNVSWAWSLEKNEAIDFWETRKGKKMANYITYRKIRQTRGDMLNQ